MTGPCGEPYHGIYRNDRGVRKYECRTNDVKYEATGRRCWCVTVEADWLERTVWGEVAAVLSDPERLLALARHYLDLRGDELRAEGDQISSLERRLAAAKRRRTNLALAAADIGPEAVAKAVAEATGDIETLEEMLRQARAWAKANAERAALVRDLWSSPRSPQSRLANPMPEYQREILAALDVRVQLADEGVRHHRWARPALHISGVLSGNLAELTGDLGNLADGLPRRPRSSRPGRCRAADRCREA